MDANTIHPHWQAGISEVTKLGGDLAKEGRKMKQVLHVRAEDNPADLETGGLTRISKTDSQSKWQAGPSLPTVPREHWPLRDRAAINHGKATTTASAAKLVAEGAQYHNPH